MVADGATLAAPAETVDCSCGFLRALVRQRRAHDSIGAWDSKPDETLLEDFIVTREMRRQMPLIANPDAKVLSRVEQFYAAAALVFDEEFNLPATPMVQVSPEGFGRAIVFAGNLVLVHRVLRDVHRFGFESLSQLARKGEQMIAEGSDLIRRYPTLAQP